MIFNKEISGTCHRDDKGMLESARRFIVLYGWLNLHGVSQRVELWKPELMELMHQFFMKMSGKCYRNGEEMPEEFRAFVIVWLGDVNRRGVSRRVDLRKHELMDLMHNI